MSGGLWNYRNTDLQFDIFGYVDKGDHIPNVFEDVQINTLIFDVFELMHEFDWYKCGDNSRSDYLKAKREFKEKWLSQDKDRTRATIEQCMGDLRKELYETFGLNEEEENEF